MDPHKIEQRKRVAAAMDAVVEVAKENEVGPISLSDLLLSLASALYRAQGRTKDVFLAAAVGAYEQNSRAVKIDQLKH